MSAYVGVSGVAKLLGVHPATVRQWMDLFEFSDRACPEPDVKVGKVRGWSDAGLVEWGAWYRRHKEQRASNMVRSSEAASA